MIKPFKTTLLDRHLRKKRRENEKIRQQTLRELLQLLPQLATTYSFERAYIFGSLTKKGLYHQTSDIDIAVEGLDNETYFKFMVDISDRLGREVDVIQLEKHRLQKQIIETGVEWKKQN